MSQPIAYIIDSSPLLAPYDLEAGLLARAGVALSLGQCRTAQDIIDFAPDAVAISSHALPITREVMEALPNLSLIVRWGVGFDTVDVAAATELGIAVANCPNYCTEEVSDHAAALLLACARKVAFVDREIRAERWPTGVYLPVHRLMGRTVGFVGFGRIARAAARKLSGFQFRHLAYDPFLDAETIHSYGAEKVELPELLHSSDLVSVHVPLGPTTRRLIGEPELRQMQPGAYLVNTSRGPILDEAAVVRALTEGWIAGAALDVFEKEPLALDSPLRALPNVILSPHIGATSVESIADLRREVCEIMTTWLRGDWPASVVNPDVRSRLRGRALA